MTWTKFSERLPEVNVEEVFVLWASGQRDVCCKSEDRTWAAWRERIIQNTRCEAAIAWHPITYPELPREETQEEKDMAAYGQWEREAMSVNMLTKIEAWSNALRYERAEVAKELANTMASMTEPAVILTAKSYGRLRKRCGLDK